MKKCEYRMMSISPTLYKLLLHQFPFAKKLQTQTVSKEKLHKTLSYKKAACKMLLKLTLVKRVVYTRPPL